MVIRQKQRLLKKEKNSRLREEEGRVGCPRTTCVSGKEGRLHIRVEILLVHVLGVLKGKLRGQIREGEKRMDGRDGILCIQ